MVSNLGGGLLPKAFDEGIEGRVEHLPYVDATSNSLMQLLSVESEPMMMVTRPGVGQLPLAFAEDRGRKAAA